MASLSYSNVTQTSVTLTCSGAGTPTKTRYWYFTLSPDGRKQYTSNTSTSGSVTITGLNPGTTYYAQCRYGPDLDALRTWASDGTTDGTYSGGSCSFTTDAEISYPTGDSGSYSTSNITYDSITVNLTSITSRDYSRTVYFDWYNTSSGNSGSPSLTLSSYTTSISRVMSGLSAGTQYRFRIRVINPDGTTNYNSGYFYATTKSYSTSDSASYSTSDITLDSITVNLTSITSRDYSRTVYFDWYNTSSGNSGSPSLTLNAGETSLSRVMPGLASGTQYRFKIRVLNPDGTINYESGYFYATTADINYSLSLTTSATSSSISATVTLDAVQSYDIDCTVYLDDTRALEAVISAGSLSRKRTWTTDIVPATFYKITLKDNIRNLSWSANRRTKNNFAWSPSVSSGTEFNIKAGNSDGSTSGSWNDFTKQLSKKCNDYSLAGTYSFTTAVKGNQFKASMFNQAVDAINGLVDMSSGDCKTTMSKVSAGDEIMAADINQLAACLNE